MLELFAKKNGETIRQHTDKLLLAFNQFIEIYGSSFDEKLLQVIKCACEYHDYGKTSYVFQKMIGNAQYINSIDKDKKCSIENMYKDIEFEKNIPHGYISPAFLNLKDIEEKYGEEYLCLLISAIYYHHNRSAVVTAKQMKRVLKEDIQIRYPDIKVNSKYYQYNIMNGENCEISDDITWIKYSIIIGMLNKFDYYASDTSKKYPIEINGIYNGKYISDYVREYFKNKKWNFREVQKYANDNSNENIIIIASTGIGKTEAALLWAGKNKLFYTLPLRVSINAMYKRLKEEYGYSSDKITILHSDSLSVLMDEDIYEEELTMLKYDASRRLSYPVTVCTIDQLFTFVYKYRGCEQLLATLKYSKLVIDEIQSYSPSLISKIIYGLGLIQKAGGKFSIITATLPPVLTYFMDKYGIEHKPPEQFLINDIVRHKINYSEAEDFDFNYICELSESKKVLIICNTVKRAIEVYKNLKNSCSYIKVLHSKFIRKHRNLLETEILQFASKKEISGVWITTQIAEASLDIDFDVLFTEMCTADSLLQRMGRCYRKRDYVQNTDPNIYIIDNHNGYGTVYKYIDIYDRSVQFLQKYQNNFFTENEKMSYVRLVYDVQSLKESDYFKEINNSLNSLKNSMPFIIDKNEAIKSFRDIKSSYSVIPKSIYDKFTDNFDNAKKIISNNSDIINRKNAIQFIEDNALSISIEDKRFKDISKSFFDKHLNYGTLDYCYEFDESDLSGCGLTYDKNYDSNFL